MVTAIRLLEAIIISKIILFSEYSNTYNMYSDSMVEGMFKYFLPIGAFFVVYSASSSVK